MSRLLVRCCAYPNNLNFLLMRIEKLHRKISLKMYHLASMIEGERIVLTCIHNTRKNVLTCNHNRGGKKK